MRFVISVFCLFVFLGTSQAQETTTLRIENSDGTLVNFTVELADTPELIERGLMERETLEPMTGMLFDFDEPSTESLWMKNTSLALDIIFVSASGEITAIARNAVPKSERKITASVPVKAVLKINAGEAEALNVQPGATVRHSLFGTEIIAAE